MNCVIVMVAIMVHVRGLRVTTLSSKFRLELYAVVPFFVVRG